MGVSGRHFSLFVKVKVEVKVANYCCFVSNVLKNCLRNCRAKADNLLSEYCKRGFTAHYFPLECEQVPSMQTCLKLLEDIHSSLQRGHKVAIQ